MRRLALCSMVPWAVASFLACMSTTSTSPSDPSGDAGRPDAAPDTERVLDAGGLLVAPFTCPTDGLYGEPLPAMQVLELLRVAASLDSLGQRFVSPPDAGAFEEPTAGQPCSSATDVAACRLAYANLSSNGEHLYPFFAEGEYSNPTFRGIRDGYYLAHTKGDAVGKVSNLGELRVLFPTVDAPAKAVVFAHAGGYRVECHLAGGWLREDPDGYVLVASRGHEKRCLRHDVVLFVRRDGSTTELQLIENQEDSCT
jgi:hypothetical protein